MAHESQASTTVSTKPSRQSTRIALIGCFALVLAIAGIAFAILYLFRETHLTVPLVVRLPGCQKGVYSRSSTPKAPASTTAPAKQVIINQEGDHYKIDPSDVVDDQGRPIQPTAASDIFDQLEREQCERSKGLDGVAILSGKLLTIQLHNTSAYTITGARVAFRFTSETGPTFERQYEFSGSIPDWSDGELTTNTNLASRHLRSMEGQLVSLSFSQSRSQP